MRGYRIVSIEQFLGILAHVPRRDAPCLGREQHAALPRFRHAGPKLPVEQIGMGLNREAGIGQFLFARLQHSPQRFHFPAHAIQQLAHGIYFDFAALVALQRKPDRQIFRQLHQHVLAGFRQRRGGRNTGQGFAQRHAGRLRQTSHILLPDDGIHGLRLSLAGLAQLHQQLQNSDYIFFRKSRDFILDRLDSRRHRSISGVGSNPPSLSGAQPASQAAACSRTAA